MSAAPTVHRDERSITIEGASYRWAYLFMSFGLLALVAYRSFIHHESPWDLMALVVLGGVASTAYQWFQKVLTARWVVTTLLTIVVAGVLAALVAWFR
jgi:hypothetical protein